MSNLISVGSGIDIVCTLLRFMLSNLATQILNKNYKSIKFTWNSLGLLIHNLIFFPLTRRPAGRR